MKKDYNILTSEKLGGLIDLITAIKKWADEGWRVHTFVFQGSTGWLALMELDLEE